MNKNKNINELIIKDSLSIDEYKTITKPLKTKVRKENKNQLIKVAVNQIKHLKEGEEFTVSDILDPQWDEMSDGLKRSIGKGFSKQVNDGNVPNVKYSRSTNNSTFYIKNTKPIIPFLVKDSRKTD